jgi:hypothetical protein
MFRREYLLSSQMYSSIGHSNYLGHASGKLYFNEWQSPTKIDARECSGVDLDLQCAVRDFCIIGIRGSNCEGNTYEILQL